MVVKSIRMMQLEVRMLNLKNGWSPSKNTFGDYVALLHSEVSEMLEAYRTWQLEDATIVCDDPDCVERPHKPEGIGSEMADVFIRLLHMCDVYGIDLSAEYERKMNYNQTRGWRHGGRTL